MKVSEIISLLHAKEVTSPSQPDKEVEVAFASDLMSDVLTVNQDRILLITGLNNLQTIRTAEMAEINTIIIARNKKASKDMIDLANDNNICVIECSYSLFRTSGVLYKAGLAHVY